MRMRKPAFNITKPWNRVHDMHGGNLKKRKPPPCPSKGGGVEKRASCLYGLGASIGAVIALFGLGASIGAVIALFGLGASMGAVIALLRFAANDMAKLVAVIASNVMASARNRLAVCDI